MSVYLFLTVFLSALAVTLLLTPLVGRLAARCGAIDLPDARKVHDKPIPRWGGIAIYAGFFLPVLLFLGWGGKGVPALVLGGTVILLVGIIDDLVDLPPWLKLLGQIAAAVALILSGIRIQFLTRPGGGMLYLGFWGIPLTLIWVVGLTNMLNLIDGLDGLAAGVSSIAATALFFVALQKGQTIVALYMVALVGAALGFLRYNFNPARIFMGDAGSLFLGFVLASVSAQGALKGAATIALSIPVVALGVPILDTVFAIIRRFLNGKPIYKADKGHLHHRLLALGFSQRQAVLLVYLVSICLGIDAVLLSRVPAFLGVALLTVSFLVFFLMAGRIGILRQPPARAKRH